MASLIVLATIVVVIAAVMSDPVLSASFGRVFGTAWSEALALLARLVKSG
jgi:uncharacterized membrane protein YccC